MRIYPRRNMRITSPHPCTRHTLSPHPAARHAHNGHERRKGRRPPSGTNAPPERTPSSAWLVFIGCPHQRADAEQLAVLCDKVLQPCAQVVTELGALSSKNNVCLQVGQLVTGVETAAGEDHTVDAFAFTLALSQGLQSVGQLNLAAAARSGVLQNLEDLRARR